MFAWLRTRFPELLPSARLVFGQPTMIRMSRAGGPVPLPGEHIHVDDLADPDPKDPRLFRSCAGGTQGRSYSTLTCVGTYHEDVCHAVQKANPTTRIAGLADDVEMNDEPAANCKAYGFKIRHQLKELGLSECVAKAAAYSPAGDLSCVPADIPGSPHHKDDDGLPTGRLACFKMVGGFHGGVDDDRACATATAKRAAHGH